MHEDAPARNHSTGFEPRRLGDEPVTAGVRRCRIGGGERERGQRSEVRTHTSRRRECRTKKTSRGAHAIEVSRGRRGRVRKFEIARRDFSRVADHLPARQRQCQIGCPERGKAQTVCVREIKSKGAIANRNPRN